MNSYHTHRTRLQSHIQTSFTPALLMHVLNLRVRPLRCGSDVYGNLKYSVHQLLSAQQRDQLSMKLTRHIMETVFSDEFVAMLLRAVFETTGQPRKESQHLYNWLLHNVYSDNLTAMVQDFLDAKAMP